MSVPCGVCTTSGWNWIPYRPRSGDSSAATGEAGDEASAVKPGGGSKTVSRWLIQQVCSAGRPASSRPGSRTRSSVRPNSPTSAPFDAAAELERHRLHAVTDAEHRHPELEQLGAQLAARPPRRPRPGRRRAPARAAGAARSSSSGTSCGSSSEKTPHSRIAARDQLRVLAAEVEDQHLVHGRRPLGRARRRPRSSRGALLIQLVDRRGDLGLAVRAHADVLLALQLLALALQRGAIITSARWKDGMSS